MRRLGRYARDLFLVALLLAPFGMCADNAGYGASLEPSEQNTNCPAGTISFTISGSLISAATTFADIRLNAYISDLGKFHLMAPIDVDRTLILSGTLDKGLIVGSAAIERAAMRCEYHFTATR